MSGEPIRVYGIDPSLSSTGVACVQVDETLPHGIWAWTEQLHVSARGCERIDEITRQLSVYATANRVTLAVIEGPIYRTPKLRTADGERSPGLRGYHERAGLWWAIVCRLKRLGIPFAVASPGSIKKYATNNGNAAKELMLGRAIAVSPKIASFDEADALFAALLGVHWLLGRATLVENTAYRADALAGVEWPTSGDALGWVSPLVAEALAGRRVAS